MAGFIKNIMHKSALELADEVHYAPGQVVSKTLAQNDYHSLTLFAFEKGEEISTHASDGDAMVVCLDGLTKITIDGAVHCLEKGQAIVMPAQKPHAVYAAERFKMLLFVSFTENR